MKNLIYLFLLILMLGLFCCSDNDNKDWSEKVVLFVAPEIIDYYPFENNSIPIDGISVRESTLNHWVSLPLDFIEGFEFETGYEYELSVTKNHLGKYPMGGFNFDYKLIEVISKEKALESKE